MSETHERPEPDRPAARARSSIVVRLIVAFILVSVVPIGVLAALSLSEAASGPEPVHQEGAGEGAESGESAPATETIGGVPIFALELAVAGASLILSVGAALYIGRTIVRPVRSLEASMHRVETGDLGATASITRDDEVGHLAAAFNRMVAGLRREAMVRDLFGQYVSPEVARLAIEQEGHLEGRVTRCTVLFADIRRFTALAEVLPPARLIGTLNRYFERMLAAVEAEGGIVNKFGGDSLLAIFGSPLNPSEDHATQAVRAAQRMRAALREFNAEQAAAEMPELRVGFGVATGEVVAGNVGSTRKLEYTVIGDPVNLAARLQELSPELGASLLVSAEAAGEVSDQSVFRSLGQVAVRGRAEPVEVFAVDEDSAGPAVPAESPIRSRTPSE